ncbi:MAG: DMT family transporter [Lachnospiraceae bacterium]|nr:DMT family transporter [Lachnospiraceae bacterium]
MKINQKTQGIMYIVGAAFFFALMNLFVRLAGDVPTFQKCFFRNIVAAFVAIIMLHKNHVKFQIGKGNLKYLLIRATAGLLGIICNFYAVDHLPISDASLLNKLSPFFAIIFSTIILKEIAGAKEWGILMIAFVGALFVIKPSMGMEFIPGLVGMFGGACAGLAYTYVRKLGQRGVNGMVIVAFFSAFSSVLLLPYLVLHFAPMTLYQWVVLLLAGVAATGGQVCITTAYTKAPAKEISVFDYSQIIFAAVLGFLVLDQIPDVYSVIGYGIILVAAIIKWKGSQEKPQT